MKDDKEYTFEELKEHVEAIKKSITHWNENIDIFEKYLNQKFYTSGFHKIDISVGENIWISVGYGQDACPCCQYTKKIENIPLSPSTRIFPDEVNCSFCPAFIHSNIHCCQDRGAGPWDYFRNVLIDAPNRKINFRVVTAARRVRSWLEKALERAQELLKVKLQEELDNIYGELKERKKNDRPQIDPAVFVNDKIKNRGQNFGLFEVTLFYREGDLQKKKIVIIFGEKVLYIERRKRDSKVFFEWDSIKVFYRHLNSAKFICSWEGLNIEDWIKILSSTYEGEE